MSVATESRTRRRHAEETRNRIVDAAGRLFTQAGYQGTTMDAIADAAEVSVESVYAHFKNKRTVLERFLDTAVAALRSAAASDPRLAKLHS